MIMPLPPRPQIVMNADVPFHSMCSSDLHQLSRCGSPNSPTPKHF